MIWNSTPLMTAIDVLIVAVTTYAIWRCRLIGVRIRPLPTSIALWLIALGLLAICLFYFVDLVSMYVLPPVTSMSEAMAFMGTLHRNLSWPVILFSTVAASTGFLVLLTELEEREAKVQRLFNSNIVGVFIWGQVDRIIDANEAFLRLVGYDRDDLVSGRLHWRDLTPAEWHDADDQRLAELTATGTIQPYEKEYVQKSGGRVPVLVGAANFEGKSHEGVGFAIDLTDRKRAEEAARESERRYHEAQMQLAHANRVATMGQLSTSIAHEVNQPIAAAVTNARAALRWLGAEPPNIEEVRHALGRIIDNGDRAANVIGRIRALIKKVPQRTERLGINEAILEVVALTRGEAMKNGVSVQTQLAESLPPIQGDRVQLQQVLLNLIINALEAMNCLGEGPRELVISTARADRCVLVSVRDSGPGFSREGVDRLFDAFYTTKPGGLGLGLSICRSIVEAHQGQLWATANVPHGAIFQFTLPVQQTASGRLLGAA